MEVGVSFWLSYGCVMLESSNVMRVPRIVTVAAGCVSGSKGESWAGAAWSLLWAEQKPHRELRLTQFSQILINTLISCLWDKFQPLADVPGLDQTQVNHLFRAWLTSSPLAAAFPIAPHVVSLPLELRGKQGRSFLTFKWLEFSLWFSSWRKGRKLLNRSTHVKATHLK